MRITFSTPSSNAHDSTRRDFGLEHPHVRIQHLESSAVVLVAGTVHFLLHFLYTTERGADQLLFVKQVGQAIVVQNTVQTTRKVR